MYVYGCESNIGYGSLRGECLRKVPDPYFFVRTHHSIHLLAITSPPATVAATTVTTASRGSSLKKPAPAAVVAIEGEDAVAVDIAVAVAVVLLIVIILVVY